MKKKIYLKDIKENKELLKEIFNNNNELKESCYRDTYELNMEQQLEFGELCLGKDYHKYINMYDNYSSFYLRVKDSALFIENVDKDYLSDEEQVIENFIFQLQNNYVFENLYYYEDDKNYNLYEDISYTKNWN